MQRHYLIPISHKAAISIHMDGFAPRTPQEIVQIRAACLLRKAILTGLPFNRTRRYPVVTAPKWKSIVGLKWLRS